MGMTSTTSRSVVAAVIACVLVLPWFATSAGAQFSTEYEAPASGEKPKAKAKPKSAPAKTASDTALSMDVLKAAGLDQQLAGMSTIVQASFDNGQKAKLSQLGYDTAPIGKLIASIYSGEKLIKNMADQMSRSLSVSDHNFLLNYVRGPSGLRVKSAVVAMSTPEGQQALKTYAENVAKSPGSLAPKIPLYQAIDKSTGSSEMLALMVTEAAFSYLKSVSPTGPTAKKKAQEIATAYASTLEQQRVQSKNVSLLTLAYINQSVSDADMQEWLKMAEAPAGQRAYSSLNKALVAAIQEANVNYNLGLLKIIGQQQQEKSKAAKAK